MIGFREKIVSRLINTDDIPFSMTLTSYKANNYSINGKNYKLLLVVDGEIEFLYNSSEKKLIKNQFVILNPNKIFGINKLTQNNLILEIDLDYDFVLKSSYNPISFLVNLDGTENEKENEKIVYLVKKLFYYYTTDLGVSAQKCVLVLTDMVDILYTYFLGESNEKNQINNIISTKLIEIMEKIFQNRDFDYKLGEIADELNLKASNISKLFKPIFGYGFSEYCRDVSLLSSQSVRNNNPPAMRVRDRCYTKKSPFRSIIELFKLNNTNRKVILWLIKRTAYLTQNGCANII